MDKDRQAVPQLFIETDSNEKKSSIDRMWLIYFWFNSPLINLFLDQLKYCRAERIIDISSNAHQYDKVKLLSFFADLLTTEELPALTTFKTDAMWDSYCPSEASQILSSYPVKHDLHGRGFFQDPLHVAVGLRLFRLFIYSHVFSKSSLQKRHFQMHIRSSIMQLN